MIQVYVMEILSQTKDSRSFKSKSGQPFLPGLARLKNLFKCQKLLQSAAHLQNHVPKLPFVEINLN